MKAVSLFVFFACAALQGQTFSVGVKGGGLLTEPNGRFDESKRYLVGATAEIGFHDRFAAEVDALYSRVGTRVEGARGNVGLLPILGKYYVTRRDSGVRPFVDGGVALRKIWFDFGDQRRNAFRRDATSDLGVGAVVGGGVAMGWWRLRFSPEFRYIRWGGSDFPATNRNEAQVLLGITF